MKSYGSRRNPIFAVTPDGIQHYEESKNAEGAIEAVENTTQRFLDAREFAAAHPTAYAKLKQAMTLFWAADSREQLTTIGHLCREAMQAFTTSLAIGHQVDVSAIDPASTVKRLQTVLACDRARRAA
jgi:hypothetical protein